MRGGWKRGRGRVDFRRRGACARESPGGDGQKPRRVMTPRAPFGGRERLVGILIEHFNGAFPPWLSPVQVTLIPIADRHVEYAKAAAAELKAAGIRATVDDSNERMNKKIRAAQLPKTPYMLVVGDKEMEAGAVAVRTRDNEDRGAMPLADFVRFLSRSIAERSMEL